MRYKNAIKGKQTNRLSSFKFNLLGGIKYPDVSHYFPTSLYKQRRQARKKAKRNN